MMKKIRTDKLAKENSRKIKTDKKEEVINSIKIIKIKLINKKVIISKLYNTMDKCKTHFSCLLNLKI